MAFDSYARCYDLLYRDKDYPAEAAFVHRQLQRHGPGALRVLDLGCGTGAHAAALVELGYDVQGIDLSAGMLAQAESRRLALPPAQAARMRFAQGDIRSFEVDGRFDAALSLFHVMTYQTLDEDLAAALAGVARHLRPGGVFLFDFWYGPGVLADPPAVRVRRVEDDALRVTRLAEPALHHERNAVDIHYHLFAEDKRSGSIEQIHETHHLRYWFWPELQRHIRAAGLEPVGLYEWMDESPARPESWYAYAVCRLPAS
jgi:SAM-dependent methyltransferase